MFVNRHSDFLQYLRFEKRYSTHTLTAYGQDILQFATFLKDQFGLEEVASVAPIHIRSWLAGLKDEGQSARTLNRKISSLQSFYRFLQRQGVVTTNPARQLHALRVPERLPVYLRESETRNLLEEISFEPGFKGFTDRLICELLYQTGMRRGELLQLKETDVEWSLRQIRVLGKGGKERLVPVSPELLERLRTYIGHKRELPAYDHSHLLVLEHGAPLYPAYIYRIVNKYLSQITTLQRKSPHVLRHTFATHLLANGANIQAIKDLLGHSSLAATQVYTHNHIEKLKEMHQKHHPRG
jgi:integrase/recombinase XerC